MRKNPNYSIYYNCWARLFFLGIGPVAMLIYLNYKIYKDIQLRQENRRRQSSSAAAMNSLARRKMEDNLALVFIGIVAVFLVCHMLRVGLNFHEMLVIDEAMACSQARQRSFPKWAIITNFFSHFLLVINASINMIIYCILNSAFRSQFIQILK